MIELRVFKGAQVRAKKKGEGENAKRSIEGYGAVFNQDYVLYNGKYCKVIERIKPGAFTRSLKEKQDVRCCLNHNPDNVLGRTGNGTMRVAQDDKGTPFETDLDMRTTVAQNVFCYIDRGDIEGCSFSFNVRKENWSETVEDDFSTYVREIEDVDLFEMGPVLFPAYEGTSVAARGKISFASELRSAAWAVGIPEDLRKRITARAKKQDDDDTKCACRCVACARDNDCESCVDHMVDCGDEDNCRCMSKRNATPGAEAGTEVIDIERARLQADVDHRLRALHLPIA